MNIQKYTYVDLHYSESESKEAEVIHKRLVRLGYNREVRDIGSDPHDYCDQYLKYNKPIKQ